MTIKSFKKFNSKISVFFTNLYSLNFECCLGEQLLDIEHVCIFRICRHCQIVYFLLIAFPVSNGHVTHCLSPTVYSKVGQDGFNVVYVSIPNHHSYGV